MMIGLAIPSVQSHSLVVSTNTIRYGNAQLCLFQWYSG